MPSHHSNRQSRRGPAKTSRRDFSFGACLYEVQSALLRSRSDGSVRVLGHHGSKQPASNSESTLRNGAGCFRNSHVAFGVLGDGALSAVGSRDVEVRSHSPGLRHANVTAITGAHLTPNISPRMNGGVNQKTPRWNSRDQLRGKERNLRQVLTNNSWVARRYFGKRIEDEGP